METKINKKKMFYIATFYPKIEFYTLLELKFNMNPNIQRFHWLLSHGLVDHFNLIIFGLRLDNNQKYKTDNIEYTDLSLYKNKIFNNTTNIIKLIKEIKNNSKDGIVMLDAIQVKNSILVFLLGKMCGSKIISIVTDRPEDIYMNMLLRKKLSLFMIKKSDSLIVMSENMGNYYKTMGSNNYLVVDTIVEREINKLHLKKYVNNPNVISYAGYISKSYNVNVLVESVKYLEGFKVNLYGPIDPEYSQELNTTLQNDNICYGGVLDEDSLVDELQKSKFLINPRPVYHPSSDYAFPIKTSFYMRAGIPTISTKLSGISAIYFDYIHGIVYESAEELAQEILSINKKSTTDLFDLSVKAQEFITQNKNYKATSKLIFEHITSI